MTTTTQETNEPPKDAAGSSSVDGLFGIWQPIGTAPIHTKIIACWSKSGHCEDATLHIGDDDMITHCLFDGERLNDEPSHWMPFPSVPNNDATSFSDGVKMLAAQSDPSAFYHRLCDAVAEIGKWKTDFDVMKRERDEARQIIADALSILPCGHIPSHTPSSIPSRIRDLVESWVTAERERDEARVERDEWIARFRADERLIKEAMIPHPENPEP